MLRFQFLILFAALVPVFGQNAALQPATRPVLKALPIGGDDDVATPQQVSNVTSVTAAPTASPEVPAKPLEAVPAPSPLEVKPTGDDALRLQIFLDEANFGPGIVDGKPGRFTELAVQSWNEVNR